MIYSLCRQAVMAAETVHPEWKRKERLVQRISRSLRKGASSAVLSQARQSSSTNKAVEKELRTTLSRAWVQLHVQIGSSDGTLCIKRSVHEGRVMFSVCAVLHHLERRIAPVFFSYVLLLGFKTPLFWLEELDWRVRIKNSCFSEWKEKIVFLECFLHLSSLVSVKSPNLLCLSET